MPDLVYKLSDAFTASEFRNLMMGGDATMSDETYGRFARDMTLTPTPDGQSIAIKYTGSDVRILNRLADVAQEIRDQNHGLAESFSKRQRTDAGSAQSAYTSRRGDFDDRVGGWFSEYSQRMRNAYVTLPQPEELSRDQSRAAAMGPQAGDDRQTGMTFGQSGTFTGQFGVRAGQSNPFAGRSGAAADQSAPSVPHAFAGPQDVRWTPGDDRDVTLTDSHRGRGRGQRGGRGERGGHGGRGGRGGRGGPNYPPHAGRTTLPKTWTNLDKPHDLLRRCAMADKTLIKVFHFHNHCFERLQANGISKEFLYTKARGCRAEVEGYGCDGQKCGGQSRKWIHGVEFGFFALSAALLKHGSENHIAARNARGEMDDAAGMTFQPKMCMTHAVRLLSDEVSEDVPICSQKGTGSGTCAKNIHDIQERQDKGDDDQNVHSFRILEQWVQKLVELYKVDPNADDEMGNACRTLLDPTCPLSGRDSNFPVLTTSLHPQARVSQAPASFGGSPQDASESSSILAQFGENLVDQLIITPK